jgi:class 3 adenylate cyclase
MDTAGDGFFATFDGGRPSVVVAARVMAKAGDGQVLVTNTVKDLVAGSGLTFAAAGTHELKGIRDPWQLYAAVK